MGRIKNKTVKRAARELIEKYYYKLTNDFDLNKKILEQVADVPSKRVRNKIAGFTTHLMRRIQKGPVKGVSLKVQEEQREKLFDKPPAKSKVDIDQEIEVDDVVMKMLNETGLGKLVENKHVTKVSRNLMKED